MIHIVTIHWKSDIWIDLQLKYFNKYIQSPFKVYAFLNQIPNISKHKNKYFYYSTENIKSHAIKLNILADMASMESRDDGDIIMFIDGDAFPIAYLSELINNSMKNNKLIAVQRQENYGDIQPHPCFCLTTLKFWKEINGDWKAGSIQWQDTNGKNVSDVGGMLLKQLEVKKQNWLPLLRSNQINPDHPMYFAIYGKVVYHHGAGFRSPVTRSDMNNIKFLNLKKFIYSIVKNIVPLKWAIKYFAPLTAIKKKNQKKSVKMFQTILNDDLFFNNNESFKIK